MNDFIKRVLQGNGIIPEDVCLQAFSQNFEGAVDVEWFKKENFYEAIFYRNNLEHIAIFNLSGLLEEYSQNLPLEYLPEHIKTIVSSKGEIMNSVLKNKGNMLEYEIILRDNELNRHLIILSDVGGVIEEKKL